MSNVVELACAACCFYG